MSTPQRAAPLNLGETEDPFEALETQRDNHLHGKPGHGETITIKNGSRYFIQTSGSPEGTDVYVFGQLIENTESVFTEDKALKQPEGTQYENYEIAAALGRKPGNVNIKFAEYDAGLENVAQMPNGDVYFRVDGEI